MTEKEIPQAAHLDTAVTVCTKESQDRKRVVLFPRGSSASLADRLWARVRRGNPEECWNWAGHTNHFGHGMFWMDGTNHYAHRVSYELHKGAIPAGLWALHRCDNPRCVNPAHLYLGTAKDNSRDIIVRTRMRKFFTAEQIADICAADAAGIDRTRIAAKYKKTARTITEILRGEHYKPLRADLPRVTIDPNSFPKVKRHFRAGRRGAAHKLGMLYALRAGKTITEVRNEFGYDLGYLSRLKNGKEPQSIDQLISMLEQGE